MTERRVSRYASAVRVGDLLLISLQSNPSTGPANPDSDLKVKVTGEAIKLVAVVFAPPAKPMPGAPGQIQAYLIVEKAGEAKVEVTPISGSGQPGIKARGYKVTVAAEKP